MSQMKVWFLEGEWIIRALYSSWLKELLGSNCQVKEVRHWGQDLGGSLFLCLVVLILFAPWMPWVEELTSTTTFCSNISAFKPADHVLNTQKPQAKTNFSFLTGRYQRFCSSDKNADQYTNFNLFIKRKNFVLYFNLFIYS